MFSNIFYLIRKTVKYSLLLLLFISTVSIMGARSLLQTAKDDPIALRQSLEDNFGINIRYQSALMETQFNQWEFIFHQFKLQSQSALFQAEKIHLNVSFFHHFFETEPSFLTIDQSTLELTPLPKKDAALNQPLSWLQSIQLFNLVSNWGNITLDDFKLSILPAKDHIHFSYINYQYNPIPSLVTQLSYQSTSRHLSIPSVWAKMRLSERQQWHLRAEIPLLKHMNEIRLRDASLSGLYTPQTHAIHVESAGQIRLISQRPMQDFSGKTFLALPANFSQISDQITIRDLKLDDLTINHIYKPAQSHLWQIQTKQQSISDIQILLSTLIPEIDIHHSEGTLDHLSLTFDPLIEQITSLKLNASDALIEFNSSYVTTLGPISTSLNYANGRGLFNANSEYFQLGLPKLYKNIKRAHNIEASGHLVGPLTSIPDLTFDHIQLQTEHGTAVSMKARLSNLSVMPDIYYKIQAPQMSANEAKLWYPNTHISSVLPWMNDNIKEGIINNFLLELQGSPTSIADYLHEKHHFKIELETTDLTFTPFHDWLPIEVKKGHLSFFKNDLTISIPQANTQGVDLTNVMIQYSDQSSHTMHINGQTSAPAPIAQDYLKQSRLDSLIGLEAFLNSAQFKQGELITQLALDVPLTDSSNHTLSLLGKTHFNDTELMLLGETIQGLKGTISFNNGLINSQKAQALWRNQPIQFHIFSQPEVTHYPLTLNTKLTFNPSLFLPNVSGETNLDLSMQFPAQHSTKAMLIELNSNLRGVSSELPIPFNKLKQDQRLLTLSGEHTTNGLSLTGTLDNFAGMELFLPPSSTQFQQSKIWIGSNDINPSTLGLSIEIDLPTASYERWQTVYADWQDEYQSTSTQPSIWPEITYIHAQFKRFRLGKEAFSNVKLQANRSTNNHSFWLADIDTDSITGTIETDLPSRYIKANLNQFNLSKLQTTESSTNCTTIDPFWSTLALSIDRFSINNHLIGSLKANAYQQNGLLSIPALTILEDDDFITATLTQSLTDEQTTKNHLVVQSSNDTFEKTALLIGLDKKSMNADNVILKADMTWEGAFNCPSKRNLIGHATLKTDKGSIEGVNIGAGRVLGLLNLSSLKRRITLDVSDITDPGLPFDNILFDFNMNQGTATLHEINIESPAADMSISGTADLIDETIDLRALITPKYIGSAISIYALLGISTLNIAAGIGLFLANEAVEQNDGDDVLTEVYEVKGSWKDPIINRE